MSRHALSRMTLDTSIGVSEPRAFTVRERNVRPCSSHAAARVHRSPLPTSVTTANRPLPRNGMGETVILILRNYQAIYVFRKDLTG
ncbi:conserved hypothetical protein [Bradyrhizobium sp. ORS 375]|nr:conserved hypothetical protein [Bradyrhizobium sp. ORS 375]